MQNAPKMEFGRFKGKRLLILGGAAQHIKLVEAARDLGAITYVTDYYTEIEKSPAKAIADYGLSINTFDIDAICNFCEKEGIDGVLSAYLDTCQIPYCQICNRLSLPCFGNEHQHRTLTSKSVFKRFSKMHGADVVPEYDLDSLSDDLSAAAYPVLVKPSDSRGSRGQMICETPDELKKALDVARSESRSGEILIERYMGQANDLQLVYFVIDGEPILLRVQDRLLGSKDSGLDKLCMATVLPSKCEKDYINEADKKVSSMIKHLGLENAPVFLQAFMEGDKALLYDPGLRLPGNESDRILLHNTGIDIPKVLVEFALTGTFPKGFKESLLSMPRNAVTSMLFPALKPGRLSEVSGLDEISSHDNVIGVSQILRPGDIVPESHNILQRFCEIDLSCNSYLELKKTIDWIFGTLSVKDSHGHDMLIDRLDTCVFDQYPNEASCFSIDTRLNND